MVCDSLATVQARAASTKAVVTGENGMMGEDDTGVGKTGSVELA